MDIGSDMHDRLRRNLPVTPKLPPKSPRSDGAVAICGECGRTVYQMEMYCCMNDRCPVQVKVTC